MKKKLGTFAILITLATCFLVACSSQSQSESSRTKITIATDSDTAPFTFKKDGQFKGYDIDVLKAIFKDSDKYEISFITTAFDSILTGVDADRYQIAANDFNYNQERAEKYLFSDPISKSNYAVTSKSGTSYDSLDQLSGKKTEALAGSNYAQILENWNKANPDKEPIQINYAAAGTALTTRVQHIENGSIDFILYDAISSQYIVKDQGFDLTVTQLKTDIGSEKDGLEYLLFAKTKEGKELKRFVDKRIKELKEDGTLSDLSTTYFGGDFASNLN
ncbi:transporter substrate-binding domain-containing protein [Streptococcus saliviloxodontae]|uniref:Polar amino acid transport system substrate-binding protein n=1 Tax=Streptococcus saliviloxodontae TaxID=1349416 RepID=A0ABS2PLA9_9STRE|nr:transporter substrate-binding domain-containing protein [Streptococcus saliviloxodontae]MBM7636217.1 polar amino acid transport system substrate-binding protein [Streptococcus saliviloxodontae]